LGQVLSYSREEVEGKMPGKEALGSLKKKQDNLIPPSSRRRERSQEEK